MDDFFNMGLKWTLSTCFALAFLGLTACGDGKSGSATRVQVTAPTDGTVVRTNRVTVRGTVSPADASIQVLGRSAQVANGVFSSSVALHAGTNDIDVVATAPDTDPTTTAVTVIRKKSKNQPTIGNDSAPAPSSNTRTTPSGTNCGAGIIAGTNTSCPFARNVVAAYERTGGGTVRVYSPVTRKTYFMSCTSSPPHVCTGANNASVYFP
jgi:hypothetical protein